MEGRSRETFDKVIKVPRRCAAGSAVPRPFPRRVRAVFGYYENALWYANENLSDVLSRPFARYPAAAYTREREENESSPVGITDRRYGRTRASGECGEETDRANRTKTENLSGRTDRRRVVCRSDIVFPNYSQRLPPDVSLPLSPVPPNP